MEHFTMASNTSQFSPASPLQGPEPAEHLPSLLRAGKHMLVAELSCHYYSGAM